MKSLVIAGHPVSPGENIDLALRIGQRAVGTPVDLPVRVVRAVEEGPTVFVSGAVHGDELNGTGIIHELMFNTEFTLLRGTLILVPVVNLYGLEAGMRYMPDRRDLNRCFPGSPKGSMASRTAHAFFDGIVKQCDYGIDLHTAAEGRTNFPNVRGDLKNRRLSDFARSFGCELMVNGAGPEGSLRRAATDAGCPTIILEAGEPNKIEPGVVELGVRGILSALSGLGMLDATFPKPAYQTRVDKSVWVRAETGGILRCHVTPGQVVEAGDPIATNLDLFGAEQNLLCSPIDGVVLGMTVSPVVQPGEPVCHVALPRKSVSTIRKALRLSSKRSLDNRLRVQLATSITVSERESITTRDEACESPDHF